MKKLVYITSLFWLISCEHTTHKSNKKEASNSDSTQILLPINKTIKFLWRDSSSSIVIDKEFCKTISDPEKAALAYVATFIGNECIWDEEYTNERNNLKCEIITALDLGYQCSDKHLGFLKSWFRNDPRILKEIENCPKTPYTATVQETFEEIVLTNKGNEIMVFFKASGVNLREAESWTWSETDYFQLNNNSIKLTNKDKSKIEHKHFDSSEE